MPNLTCGPKFHNRYSSQTVNKSAINHQRNRFCNASEKRWSRRAVMDYLICLEESYVTELTVAVPTPKKSSNPSPKNAITAFRPYEEVLHEMIERFFADLLATPVFIYYLSSTWEWLPLKMRTVVSSTVLPKYVDQSILASIKWRENVVPTSITQMITEFVLGEDFGANKDLSMDMTEAWIKTLKAFLGSSYSSKKPLVLFDRTMSFKEDSEKLSNNVRRQILDIVHGLKRMDIVFKGKLVGLFGATKRLRFSGCPHCPAFEGACVMGLGPMFDTSFCLNCIKVSRHKPILNAKERQKHFDAVSNAEGTCLLYWKVEPKFRDFFADFLTQSGHRCSCCWFGGIPCPAFYLNYIPKDVDDHCCDLCINIKRCPRCGVLIEKNGGCNHMRCQMCKKDFQWSDAGMKVTGF